MLERPFFTPVVVALWCVTTGWLVVTKILPDRQAAPPGQRRFFAPEGPLPPVAWTVTCDDQPVGWALTRLTRNADDWILVSSRVHVDRLPWDRILPAWAALPARRLSAGQAALDVRGRLAVDPRGRLESFSTSVDLPGGDEPILLSGVIEGDTVRMHLVSGGVRSEPTFPLPADVTIGDELSPQATLTGLVVGQRWTVPVYSPVRIGHPPLQILHAEVGPRDLIAWGDRLVTVHVVSYREDPSSDREPRCRLWVDPGGRVLRQEAVVLGVRLAFVRRADDEAVRMAELETEAEGRQAPESAGDGLLQRERP